MTPLRVLVVDDSVVVRRLVTDVLDRQPDIEVVGIAANGQIALDKLDKLQPDVVTLDIEMPVMGGLETLREIRKRSPRLPVIMFSTLTEHGAAVTLDCLASGANDFVTKPANVGSVRLAMDAVEAELTPKIRALCGRPNPVLPSATATAPVVRPTVPLPEMNLAPTATSRPVGAGRVQAVVIGVSTGGPNALAALWCDLGMLAVPIFVVQHMPPVFTAMLAKRLSAAGCCPAVEATDAGVAEPGNAYIAPGDYHLTLQRSGTGISMHLDQGDKINSCRPSVEPLFDSAARAFGPNVVAVMLTGMGRDGADGAGTVARAGGRVIAQDESTSVVWGMPGAVVAAGNAHAVLPLDRIAAEVRTLVGSARTTDTLSTIGTR